MFKFLLGELTVQAADVVLTSQIPTTAEAEAILASTVSAEELDKINRATTILQTFFAVRKQLKNNKAKIASVASGIIPTDIITKNNALLSKTDEILSAAYSANGKKLLPYQDPTDIPTATVSAQMSGSSNSSGVITEREVVEMQKDAKDITNEIDSRIATPKIVVTPPAIVQDNKNKNTLKIIGAFAIAALIFSLVRKKNV